MHGVVSHPFIARDKDIIFFFMFGRFRTSARRFFSTSNFLVLASRHLRCQRHWRHREICIRIYASRRKFRQRNSRRNAKFVRLFRYKLIDHNGVYPITNGFVKYCRRKRRVNSALLWPVGKTEKKN